MTAALTSLCGFDWYEFCCNRHKYPKLTFLDCRLAKFCSHISNIHSVHSLKIFQGNAVNSLFPRGQRGSTSFRALAVMCVRAGVSPEEKSVG